MTRTVAVRSGRAGQVVLTHSSRVARLAGQTTLRVTRGVVVFLGPVSAAVRDDLSKEERRRSITKGVVTGLTTGAGLWATMTSPEMITMVVVPLGLAILVGGADAISRYRQGVPREMLPPPDPQYPAYPGPVPAPLDPQGGVQANPAYPPCQGPSYPPYPGSPYPGSNYPPYRQDRGYGQAP